MSAKTTVSVLGAAGAIAQRHIEHLKQNPRAELHSIVEPSPDGQRMAASLGVPCFNTIEAFIKSFPRSKPQVAIIATPSHLHVPQATQLLPHGLHLLIEKPVCTSMAEGAMLLEAAEKAKHSIVLSGYHRRSSPYVAGLKAMVESGQLGRIIAVQGTWAARKPAEYFAAAKWRTQRGSGGTLLTNISHEIDLFRYLFGNIERVFLEVGSNVRNYEVDETGAVTMRFASGAVGTFIFSNVTLSPFSFEAATGENPETIPKSGENVYRILGTHGSVEFPSLKRYFCNSTAEGHWGHSLAKDDTMAPSQNPKQFEYNCENAPFTRRLDHLIDVVQDGVTPICTLRDGVMATAILEALKESGEIGMPVRINLDQ